MALRVLSLLYINRTFTRYGLVILFSYIYLRKNFITYDIILYL